jgi:hypothetical protein
MRLGISALFLGALLTSTRMAAACTVFFGFDSRFAFAGNNEDWADTNSQIWFVPASKNEFGIVYFGFGQGKYPKGDVAIPNSIR